MSLDINQIALHQLIKRDEQNLELVLRDSLLEPTTTVVEMVAELHRVYSAKNKAYGLFSEESELAQALRLQRQGEEDFLAFSRAATGRLKYSYSRSIAATGRLRDELAKYPFADGGIVLFCHYRYLAVEYLLVTVLNNLSSMRVNENLDINPTHYLDINHADIVARIDLTEWETNPQSTRYLTFLKGRVGRKVADFFMDFLGASEGLNAKAQNRGLLQAVDDFTAEAQLDKAERQNVRQQVYSYCNEQLQAGEEIELESLSKELSGVSEVSFSEFTAEKGYELEESFPADRSTLRQLTKYAGSGGGLTINFDAMLLGERIFWDPATDTLTIKGTPPNLRDQLQRRTSGGK
ncbi:Nucleoid-associated protein NdpA [Salmonella enterica subsp. enterica serovar Give str. S5-487]|nr:Nucleoid-associated protein NdpA [Salmonella enterica subsp. enterica serovar Give str. S5-487]